jgi:hypothetical protein
MTGQQRKTTQADQDTTLLARSELHGAEPLGTPTIAMAFGDELWNRWVDEVRTNPAYHLPDPDDPADTGMTGSSGANPPPAIIVEYGDGPNDYVSTDFDAGQVLVRDGNDPTGKAWKFPEAAWRRFVAKVRGEELPDDPDVPKGPTMHEAAAEQNARTFGRLAYERQHGNPDATGVDADRPAAKSTPAASRETGSKGK